MLDKTTQHYRGVIHYPFRKHFKSRYPGANAPRLNEWVATDTFFNDAPAMDDGVPGHGGCTMMQIFYGLTSGTVHGYPMKSEKQVGLAFEDHIRKVGALKVITRSRSYTDVRRIFCVHTVLMTLNLSLTINTRTKLNGRFRMSSAR